MTSLERTDHGRNRQEKSETLSWDSIGQGSRDRPASLYNEGLARRGESQQPAGILFFITPSL